MVVLDIALLRDLGHQQVIAHQEDHGVDLFGIQPQAPRHLLGQRRATLMMVVAVALADVVKYQGQEYQG